MYDIERAKFLISQREAIDAELAAIFSNQPKERKQNRCGTCGEEGHSTRTCPKKAGSATPNL